MRLKNNLYFLLNHIKGIIIIIIMIYNDFLSRLQENIIGIAFVFGSSIFVTKLLEYITSSSKNDCSYLNNPHICLMHIQIHQMDKQLNYLMSKHTDINDDDSLIYSDGDKQDELDEDEDEIEDNDEDNDEDEDEIDEDEDEIEDNDDDNDDDDDNDEDEIEDNDDDEIDNVSLNQDDIKDYLNTELNQTQDKSSVSLSTIFKTWY
jgi:hypothetical protein